MRIVQLANFYGPRSGGLRTALHHLGAGYAALGHEVVLVVPGHRRTDELMPGGVRRITLAAAKIPGTGGYRAVDPCRVRALLAGLRPDRIEVSDRLTLRGMGPVGRGPRGAQCGVLARTAGPVAAPVPLARPGGAPGG